MDNRYEKTYQRYCVLMQRLSKEFCYLSSMYGLSNREEKTNSVLNNIKITINTAEQERNLPSEELYVITSELAALHQLCEIKGESQAEAWKNCFKTLYEASNVLLSITDDVFVQDSFRLAKVNIK